MGECGCGEFRPRKAYQIGDKVLAVEIYPGCDDCNTGLMVTLWVMTPKEAQEWGIDEFTPFDQYGQDSIPLLSGADLLEAYTKNDVASEYDNTEDFLADNALDLLQSALRIRRNKKPGED